MKTPRWMTVCLVLLLGFARQGGALVSEARPGIAYVAQAMFVEKKIVEAGQVAWVTLAYVDPRASRDCNNLIDVFDGRELFDQIPEKSWVLVDFSLRSLVIQAGFAGDADVSRVIPCSDEQACRELQAQYQRPQKEGEAVSGAAGDLVDAGRRLTLGRDLVKAARCRGCHKIEGFGAEHAPSLTWRRAKYRRGWLEGYLAAPYRLRPAMTSLMMLRYTSPLAQPSLQPQELMLVADFLQRLAWFTPPAGRYRLEPWKTYRCQPCHARLYAERPLTFEPSAVSSAVRRELANHRTFEACLACHTFGDLRTVDAWSGPPYPFPMAPDLLLALEKLRLDYFIDYVRDPAYLQPDSSMTRLGFTELQLEDVEAWGRLIQHDIERGMLHPLHRYYRMQKSP